jgi:uncharacterized protein (DUF342 family)
MARREQEFVEGLIRESERTLEEVEGLHPERVPAAEHSSSLAGAGVELVEDGRMELEVSEDRMKAVAAFIPPSEGGKPLTVEDAERLLEARGVRSGIDSQGMRDALLACNTELATVSDVVVARGVSPRDEVPEHLVVEESLLKKRSPGGQKIDFREISPFIMVQKGQMLARIVGRQEGEGGRDVSGAPIPFGRRPVVAERTVVAACDGRFVLLPHSFQVNEVLDVQRDVDYSTGHVSFPGDVVIRGEIKRGFKVSSGGTLYCRGLIDATEVRAGRDVETERGILGRSDGLLSAAGSVRAKFIENCRVEAGGEIRVETGVVNSFVFTLDRLETGPRGVLVGGRCVAANGVSVHQVGSASGTRTEVLCGIDYLVQRKLEWIRDRNIALAVKLKAVQDQARGGPAGSPRLVELEMRLKAAIRKLNTAARSLVGGLDKNEEAAVEVRGSISPGSYIEICHVPFVVQRDMRRVRFMLDTEKGKVVAAPL